MELYSLKPKSFRHQELPTSIGHFHLSNCITYEQNPLSRNALHLFEQAVLADRDGRGRLPRGRERRCPQVQRRHPHSTGLLTQGEFMIIGQPSSVAYSPSEEQFFVSDFAHQSIVSRKGQSSAQQLANEVSEYRGESFLGPHSAIFSESTSHLTQTMSCTSPTAGHSAKPRSRTRGAASSFTFPMSAGRWRSPIAV